MTPGTVILWCVAACAILVVLAVLGFCAFLAYVAVTSARDE